MPFFLSIINANGNIRKWLFNSPCIVWSLFLIPAMLHVDCWSWSINKVVELLLLLVEKLRNVTLWKAFPQQYNKVLDRQESMICKASLGFQIGNGNLGGQMVRWNMLDTIFQNMKGKTMVDLVCKGIPGILK